VYMELEAMALSRDIPVAFRWVVDPIVRRVSKNSLMTSLRQTQEAVHSMEGAVGRVASPPPARAASDCMLLWTRSGETSPQ